MAGFVLRVTVAGRAERREFRVERVVVGREVGDVVLPDPLTSSTHAELLWRNGRLLYRDLASTNGSFVNGARVAELELQPGTTVQVGDCQLTFEGPLTAMPAVVAPARTPDSTRLVVIGLIALGALLLAVALVLLATGHGRAW